MSKFKVGDKVYRLEDIKEADTLWEVTAVQVMKGGDKEHYNYVLKAKGVSGKFLGGNNNNVGRVAMLNFEEDLKLYKTPHDRLLELGWEFREYLKYKNYEKFDEKSRRTMSIRIFNDEYGIYYFLNNFTYVDLELAEILVDYLKEMR